MDAHRQGVQRRAAPSIPDGGETGPRIGGPGGQGGSEGGRQQHAVGTAVFGDQRFYGFPFHRQVHDQFPVGLGGEAIHVGQDPGIELRAFPEGFGIPLCRFRVGLAVALCFFTEGDLETIDRFGRQVFARIRTRQVVDQQLGRSAVEEDVVEIDIDVGPFFRLEDFNPEQPVFQQVHRTAEARSDFVDRVDDPHERMPLFAGMVFHSGHPFFQYDPGQGIGMGADQRLGSGGQASGIDSSREFVQGGLLVVSSFRGEPLASQIDAQLGLGEGIRHRDFSFMYQN